MLYKNIEALINYGIKCSLIDEDDRIYVANRLLELFLEDAYEEPQAEEAVSTGSAGDRTIQESAEEGAYSNEASGDESVLEEILGNMLDYAYDKGLIKENTVTYRDLFDTKIMAVLVSKPSIINKEFLRRYNISPEEATRYYYELSQNTDYIRRYRVKKDMKWVASTEYGDLDITINLSKPEKDPKSIAAAKNAKQSGYPKCLLCKENEGYAGTLRHPARQNHRIIPIQINGQKWGFQYSPYVYYNEHCIVLNYEHIPMKIDRETFIKLFDFVKQFPHYFLGSNADLPIVGGSILSHDHFQGGNYEFAMAKAAIEKYFVIKGYENVKAGIVKWPMSVIRLASSDLEAVINLAEYILDKFKGYTDEKAYIFAETDGEPHNTITPIARIREGLFELDLVLRNNITTDEHPLGVYHPHAELHHIKKENIGLIEVMGLAVLPSRLKEEMEVLAKALTSGSDINSLDEIKHHADWAGELKLKHSVINEDNVYDIIKEEIGIIFMKVLEHAGIFKRDEEGMDAFLRFIEYLNV